jgi:pimeloyl-ACP methyl ester carboxylesterase
MARDHHVLALDLRGHGHSTTRPDDVSPEANIGDVAFVIERLAADPVVLVGQSLGANLAFLVAARHPALVRALVVAEGNPGADPDGEGARSIERWLDTWPVPFPTRSAAVGFFSGSALRGEAWADGLELRDGRWWPRFDAAVMVATLRAAIAEEHWTDWQRIRCPTLVVRAGRGYFAASDLESMAAGVPVGRYAELPAAGHDLHLEDPAGWRRILGEFLPTGG